MAWLDERESQSQLFAAMAVQSGREGGWKEGCDETCS